MHSAKVRDFQFRPMSSDAIRFVKIRCTASASQPAMHDQNQPKSCCQILVILVSERLYTSIARVQEKSVICLKSLLDCIDLDPSYH